MKIKQIKLKIKSIRNKYKLFFSKKIYLSFGENCLADDILARYNLKSFTTPFSHGRGNVEYILNMENDNYNNFLNTDKIIYEDLNGKQVPRLQHYKTIKNSYHELHTNGFEFTHHDILKDESIKFKFQDRVNKLLSYRGKKKYIILYHHRNTLDNDFELLIYNLNTLKSIYSTDMKKSEVVLFKQTIIKNEGERDLEISIIKDIYFFNFKTTAFWEGDDPNLLWAKCDEDLIEKMINKIKEL